MSVLLPHQGPHPLFGVYSPCGDKTLGTRVKFRFLYTAILNCLFFFKPGQSGIHQFVVVVVAVVVVPRLD